ncbi:serine hydrolase domain-containing protein [Sphingomonas ginsenosidivorax]|nr:serine hydrolase [Sphingomonas ginsenosidivorax]
MHAKPVAVLAILAVTVAAAAQRAPGTARHGTAQYAGMRALHLCTGYFATEAPRALIDATIEANAGPAPATPMRTEVDERARTVSVRYAADMPPRIAVSRAGMGCTMLPIGADVALAKQLIRVPLEAPRLDDRSWPMGDRDARAPLPARDEAAVERVLDAAFEDEKGAYGGKTWGVVVLHDGKIVAERYSHGFARHIAARTNSMCKSLGATLVGVGVRTGRVDLNRPAPLAEWRTPGDPRGAITTDNLLRMTSGLYSDGPQDPQVEIYRSGAAIADIAARNMMDAQPGTRFVYAGTDTNLAMRGLRQALSEDAAYPAFPYRALLWKLGMTRTVVETDWNNDFIVSGQCWSTARDFARLGMLYLADGRWNGERLLPAGWTTYVSSPLSVQPKRPSIGGDAGYGAQFWLFGGMDGLPSDAFSAFGAMGQYAVIVPSRNLVVVRRGLDHDPPFRIQKFAADVMNAVAPQPASRKELR